ncbi:MAG: hypothetical protein ACI9MC_000560 [Kiritimatiellia bacterium]|jgi:hypothetical protein
MCVVDIIVEVFRRAEFEVLMETYACRSVECVTGRVGERFGVVVRGVGPDSLFVRAWQRPSCGPHERFLTGVGA